MEEIISIHEKENKNDIKEEQKNEKDNEKIERIFESKKDIIFFEGDYNEEINELEEKEDKSSLPFFKALHKA